MTSHAERQNCFIQVSSEAVIMSDSDDPPRCECGRIIQRGLSASAQCTHCQRESDTQTRQHQSRPSSSQDST